MRPGLDDNTPWFVVKGTHAIPALREWLKGLDVTGVTSWRPGIDKTGLSLIFVVGKHGHITGVIRFMRTGNPLDPIVPIRRAIHARITGKL